MNATLTFLSQTDGRVGTIKSLFQVHNKQANLLALFIFVFSGNQAEIYVYQFTEVFGSTIYRTLTSMSCQWQALYPLVYLRSKDLLHFD